ncbi:hypothetical protein BKA62DRAFT_705985 [Auriculariales sp. MPI-PUGE-AT-0066]|nr:hypothetical protein BKA62DRAFT_705985 [Auriculariales sp. MPI-PUGE-AT-0066]
MGTISASDEPERAHKKRKSRNDASARPVELETASDDTVTRPKKKRRKADTEEDVQQGPGGSEDTNTQTQDDSQNVSTSDVKKKKKRQGKDSQFRVAETAPPQPEEAVDAATTEKKTKDSKKDKKYPNPSNDESLSDQAQKALAYAHEYVRGSGWKFNKARQNWLMRNVYDSTAVPEPYVKTVYKYLKGVKGQAIGHIRETCQTIISSPDPVDASTGGEGGEDGNQASLGDLETRRQRAAVLLKTLS